MRKKITAILAVLCVCLVPLMTGYAETADGLILAAVVQAKNEIALNAPASGELAPFTVDPGERVNKGELLFSVKPTRVYSDIDGQVAAVYIQKGDIADAASVRYGAALKIEFAERYEVSANVKTGYNLAKNRNPFVGTQVYLRSLNEKYFADGVITSVEGGNFTVQVLGGDLVFTQEVKIYATPEYENKSLLGRANLSIVAPYDVSASGTVVDVAVKAGDQVKAGDYLFSYVPDKLDPELRGSANATAVKAGSDLIVKAVNVQQGASVQKGQTLASAYIAGQYELVASVEEGVVGRLRVGDIMIASFEELGLSGIEAKITRIGAVGTDADTSKYMVTLDFEVPEGVLIGMHATVAK